MRRCAVWRLRSNPAKPLAARAWARYRGRMPVRSAPAAVSIPPLIGQGRDSRARRGTREQLARVLWDGHGLRRLPRDRTLRSALRACEPRDVWWVCEANTAGPVYLLPTVEWVQELELQFDHSLFQYQSVLGLVQE